MKRKTATKPDATRELAERIALDLFTDVNGRVADHLVMDYAGQFDGTGWSQTAVADQIAAHLHGRIKT